MASKLKPELVKPVSDTVLSRDGVKILLNDFVFYFDPLDDSLSLKEAKVVDLYNYGPALKLHRGDVVFSRKALWKSRQKAIKDGPPIDIYDYNVTRPRISLVG